MVGGISGVLNLTKEFCYGNSTERGPKARQFPKTVGAVISNRRETAVIVAKSSHLCLYEIIVQGPQKALETSPTYHDVSVRLWRKSPVVWALKHTLPSPLPAQPRPAQGAVSPSCTPQLRSLLTRRRAGAVR